MCVVVLIGLSVDYVVHLATSYQSSPLKTQKDKIQQAYGEMGISIMSGAVTTFGSGVFLFGGQFALFPKFALLITITIFASFLSAMLLFGAMANYVGPIDGRGDLKFCWSKKGNQVENANADGTMTERELNR